MYRPFILLVIFLSLLACKSTPSEIAENRQSIFDLLYDTETLKVTIEGDLYHLIEESPLNEEGKEDYHEAMFHAQTHSCTISLPVRIAKRGVTRKSICSFPPIKLKFSNDTLSQHHYSSFNTYKLVTHCMENMQDVLLKEYLVYKIYNYLTDNSFRVKLMEINYQDHLDRLEDKTYFACIIEEDEEMAHRLNAQLIETDITALDRAQYAQMVVFQYMIGNTDWNLTNGHNLQWIQKKELPSPTPVPYDFDFCGLVNSPHAAPHPQLPISNVRERLLQWRGKTHDELIPILKDFNTRKEEIISICRSQKGLSAEAVEDMVDYLNTFFTIAEKGQFPE